MEKLQYKRLDNKWFVLTEDYHYPFTLREIYHDHVHLDRAVYLTGVLPDTQLWLTAPKGFVTDLASIPEHLQGIFHPDGPWAPAACIHDLLYQKCSTERSYPMTPGGNVSRIIDKEFSDLTFLRIMQSLEISPYICQTFYKAVVEFGWDAYVDPNAKPSYTTNDYRTLDYNRNYLFVREFKEPAIPDHERVDITTGCPVNVKYLNIKRAFLSGREDVSSKSE